MSNDLSPAQMKAMAQSLSDMGRRGDTQLVHVTPQEVELLKRSVRELETLTLVFLSFSKTTIRMAVLAGSSSGISQ